MANDVKIILSADGSGVKVAVGDVVQEFIKMGDSAKQAADKATSSFGATRQGIVSISEQLRNAQNSLVAYAKTAATLWVTDKLASFVAELATLNARYETLGVAMAAVGHNVGYTSDQMEAAALGMQRMGISMIESRAAAMQLVQAHINLADANGLARVAQDAAVIGAMNSSEAFKALVHGIQSAQVEVLRTIGINVTFEDGYKRTAAQLGKHVDQLTENEKTQSRLNQVMEKGRDIAGTYEAAMGTAGKQLLSMQRYVEDLKVKQGELFNEALTVAVMAYTDRLKENSAAMDTLANNGNLQKWGEGVANVLSWAADMAMGVVNAFRTVGATVVLIGELAANAWENKGDLNALKAEKKIIVDAYKDMVSDIWANSDAMRQALEDRRKAVAEGQAKTLADAAAKTASYTTAMNAYARQREQGLMSEAQYVKTVQAVYQAFYGDNHIYADTSAKAPAAVSEYQKIITSIREKIAAQKQEFQYGDKLNEADKLKLDLYSKIDAGILKLTSSQKLALDAALNELDTNIKANAAKTQAEKATLAAAEAHQKYVTSLATGLDKLKEDVAAQQESNDRLGLSKLAIADLDAAKLESQAITLDLLAIKTLDKNLDEAQYALYKAQAEELRKLAKLKRDGAAKEADIDSAKQFADEWTKATEQIGQSLTDQLMNGGRSAADYLKNLFRTLVLRPVIMAGVGSLTSGMASAASLGGSGSGGNMLGVAGNLASMYNMATAGMAAIGNLGATTIANGVGALGGDALGTLAALKGAGSANMAALGTAANYLGAAGMGVFVGGLISGGKSAIGNNSNTAVVGGAAIGAMVAGPIGAFVGGTIGGIVNAAFGHGATELSGSGTRGTFSGTSFTGSNYANYHQDGGWFSSDNNWTDTTALTAEQQASYSASFAATKASMTGMAIALGLATDKITDYTKTVDIAAGTTTEQLTAIFTGMADDMANAAAPGISTFAKIGETASATLSRLGGAITTANAWLSMLRNRLFDVSMSGADAASSLADAFGGLDKLAESSKAYYETYYTEAERTQKSTEDLAKAMALVNVALPKTKDQFRAIVSGLDLTTESGRNAYAVLLQLAPEFATAMDSIDKAAVDAANSLIKKFTGSAGVVSAMNSAALNIGDFTGSTTTLTDKLTSINTVMGDASSAVIEFRKGTVTLGEKLSDSQISAVLLADQVALLRDSADGARIDFEGLGAALDGVNTETFVATITKVFESLASRISGVLGDINTERIAVRDAALQIVNPTVMSKEAISRAIAGINTGLPSNAGVASANAILSQADASVLQAQQTLLGVQSNLGVASDTMAKDVGYYQGKVQELYQIASKYGYYTSNGNDIGSNNAYAYDAAANRLSGFAWTTGSNWANWDAYAREAGLGASTSQRTPGGLASLLDQANPKLAADEAEIARLKALLASAADAVSSDLSAQTAAANAAKKAAIDYAAALQSFAIDASKSVTKLTKLREETVKYYEQQQQLAELMSTSAGSLRKTISDYNYSQLSPDQQLAVLQGQFSSAYSLAQAAQPDGQTLAGYGDKLNSLLGPLIDKLNETNKTSLIANYLAQAESVATLIDAAMPVNYQQDSLDLLGSIDATLAALDESSRSAEQIIADAVNAGSDRTAAGLRAVGEAISGKTLPAFATGGYHAGGARLVGEYGPEVEVTGPSTIYTLSQWRAMSANRGAGNTARLEALVERQAQQLEAMSYELRAIAAATGRTAKTLERVTPDGNSLQTTVAA